MGKGEVGGRKVSQSGSRFQEFADQKKQSPDIFQQVHPRKGEATNSLAFDTHFPVPACEVLPPNQWPPVGDVRSGPQGNPRLGDLRSLGFPTVRHGSPEPFATAVNTFGNRCG